MGQRSMNPSLLHTELPSSIFFFLSFEWLSHRHRSTTLLYYSLVYLVRFFIIVLWSISNCLWWLRNALRVLVGSLHQITEPCLLKARRVASQNLTKPPRPKPKSSRPVAQKRVFRLVM